MINARSSRLSSRAAPPRRKEVVKQVRLLVEGYIEVAALPVKKDVSSMPVPSSWRRRHQNLTRCPLVSKEMPVDPSGAYADFPHVVGYGETITFVGGINRPKLVSIFTIDRGGGGGQGSR